MKFSEAMEKLKNGSKITRTPWKDDVYFKLEGQDVKSYQPKLSNYVYNEDIMISDGWIVENEEEEMPFYNLIPFLLKGKKAKRTDWKESFIYLDRATKCLVINSMEMFPYIPDFNSFLAEDWMELPNE